MKKCARSVRVLIALAGLTAASAYADVKVAVINSERVMRDSEPAKKAMKKLEKEFEKRGQDLEKLRQQAQKMQEDLEKNGITMGDAARKSKERELGDLSREFQRRQRELNEDVNARRNEELQSVVERVNKTIRSIAEKEGYTLILQEAVYANPSIDITDKVIRALGAESPAPGK
ncbi:MAG: OmpH family outer membrane protein [Proteobacteria bacterium]|nr:OmpH family outer membrane protein [Pseudomonadota bacterium]HQR02962.1 OmpH family outer membrane protein [Rhodocyclaceae bacterium]